MEKKELNQEVLEEVTGGGSLGTGLASGLGSTLARPDISKPLALADIDIRPDLADILRSELALAIKEDPTILQEIRLKEIAMDKLGLALADDAVAGLIKKFGFRDI